MEQWVSNTESSASIRIMDQCSKYIDSSIDKYSSLNTQQAKEENEKQMVKYEADIRNHISIEQ